VGFQHRSGPGPNRFAIDSRSAAKTLYNSAMESTQSLFHVEGIFVNEGLSATLVSLAADHGLGGIGLERVLNHCETLDPRPAGYSRRDLPRRWKDRRLSQMLAFLVNMDQQVWRPCSFRLTLFNDEEICDHYLLSRWLKSNTRWLHLYCRLDWRRLRALFHDLDGGEHGPAVVKPAVTQRCGIWRERTPWQQWADRLTPQRRHELSLSNVYRTVPKQPGIYFLWAGNLLVRVGKHKNDLSCRLKKWAGKDTSDMDVRPWGLTHYGFWPWNAPDMYIAPMEEVLIQTLWPVACIVPRWSERWKSEIRRNLESLRDAIIGSGSCRNGCLDKSVMPAELLHAFEELCRRHSVTL
jgi:hypothetical protein